MAILNISGVINSSFSTSGVLVNAAQAAGDAVFTIDLRPTNPIVIVQDNLDYGVLGWNINDAVAVVSIIGPQGQIYVNENYGAPDIVPGTSRYMTTVVTLPLDPLTDYANILKGNYTLKISWYNSVLDEYYAFLDVYQYNMDPPVITNRTVSGPYTGILKSTDITEYGNDVHQIIREHRIQYPDELTVPPPDVVSSNAEVQVTPIYTNEWNILISSFVEYRFSDLLRVYWEGSGEFTHCVYGGCIGAMYDAIETMLTTYREAMACNLNNQEAYQKRLVIVNTAWHLLNEAYWSGDAEEADEQAYIIQEQVEYSGGGVCGGATSELVTPCPPWTGGGVGGTYTFSNALVEAAGNVTWGGSLIQATTVLMVGHEVLFSGSDAGNTVSQSISAAGGILQKASDGTTESRIYVTDSLITLERADLITPANTRGYEITSTGIIEKADYTAGYVDRQLVAKDYVDLAIGAISANTFENGLTAAAGVVKLGGALLENNTTLEGTFDTAAKVLYVQFKGNGQGESTQASFRQSSITLRTYTNDTYLATGKYQQFTSSPESNGSIRMESYNTASVSGIRINNSEMLVIDTNSTKGFVYAADYSAQWTDHSLVTKKWVEDTFVPITGSGTFAALTDTPNDYTGFGGYFVRVNTAADALEYVVAAFVPATGGTFTGQVIISTTTDRPLILKQIGAGSIPGTPEGGLNIIAFQDNDGDEQGYVGIDASGNVVLKSSVTGGGVLADGNLTVNGDVVGTGTATFVLAEDAAETFVVGYNTSTGLMTYRALASVNAYTNATPVPYDIGGIEAGETFTAETMQQMWDKLLYPYDYPTHSSFVISGQNTTLECGVNLTGGVRTFTWGYTFSGNVEANTVDIDDVTGSSNLVTNTAADGTEDLDIGAAITKTTTGETHVWRITSENTKLEEFTRDFTVVWYSPFYYGTGAPSLTVAQVQQLTKAVVGPGDKTYPFTPSSQVQYFAYPASYGDLTSILDGNGFETIADWTKRVENFTTNSPYYEGGTVSYHIYEFDNITSLAQSYQFKF